MLYICSMSTLSEIKSLERKRDLLMKRMLELRPMIRGTFVKIHRRCGTANCWCANDEKGHPATRIMWSEAGKNKTKAIAKEDVKWAKEMTKNYKAFRMARQEFRAVQEELRVEIDKLEDEIISKSKKTRGFK